ncbi:uncharacterized protein LOC103131789 isoform X2 [Poecilia formosa]|uniref:uncharacterized protein LOC103131789 isoform X2 n=1 Tax=Poecilia formosa TaxID=48698 RepID=UPI0007B981D8|nr:PREDICTED: uncharacterized protein LOC103131789 isoform X2 [Poecilia formosa]
MAVLWFLVSFLSGCSSLSVHKNISAVPGQIVSLPCRLPNNKPAVVVQWTRPDLEPEYVLLFRDEQPDPENQHPSFRKRVELQDRRMEDGDVSLLLSNVTTNDTGTYECRVFQREATGRKRRTLTSDPIWTVFLDVAPPTAATFVVNVTQSSYEAEENHSITLEWTFTTRTQGSYRDLFIYCEANTDHGVLVLYQVHEGVEIPKSQDDQFSGRVQIDKDVLREGRIRLHVSRLRTEDSGLYLCDVKTEDGFNSGRCRLSVTAADYLQTQRPNLTPEPERRTHIIWIKVAAVIFVIILVVVLIYTHRRSKTPLTQQTL